MNIRLSMALLATALALSGCGRKNLPVAPTPVTAPIGSAQTPNTNAPSGAANFQRAGRLGAVGRDDLTVSPAEVTRNPTAEKKSFPLDFLLN